MPKFALVLVVVIMLAGFGRVIVPQRWEYKVCLLGDPHASCELNALGARGWELVAATPYVWKDGTISAQVFLRREVP